MADWFSGGSSKSNWFSGGSGSSSFAKQKSAQAKRMIELEEEEEGVDKDSVEYKLRTAKYGKFANNPEAVDTFLKDNAPEKFNAVKAGAQTVGSNLKSVGEGFVQGPKILASGTARALGAGEETEGQRIATNSLDASQERILHVLRDPKVSQQRKDILLNSLNEQNRETVMQAVENTRTVESETDKRRFASAAAELALTAAGGTTLRAAKGLGTTGKAAVGAAEGAALGTLGALEQEEVTPGSVAAGAGIGLLAGGALGLRSGRTAEAKDFITNAKTARLQDIIGKIPEPETRANRLLEAVSDSRRTGLTTRLQEIDDELSAISTKATTYEPELPSAKKLGTERLATEVPLTKSGAPDMRYSASRGQATFAPEATTTKSVTGKQLRDLQAERRQLQEELKTIDSLKDTSNALLTADGALVEAATSGAPKAQLKRLETEKKFLQQQLNTEANNQAVTEAMKTGTQRASGQALTTEQRAISEGLAEEFGDVATYGATTWDEQTQMAIDIANADYETAKRIAKGQQAPPDGVLGNAVYKTVENRAVREGDAQLLRELAQAPTASRTSRAAQELGVLGARDPESPITAMKELAQARKTAGLSVSQPLSIQEADEITRLAKEVSDAKIAIPSGGDPKAYGRARIAYDNYVGELMAAANKKPLSVALKTPEGGGELARKVLGLPKSVVASLDNSVIGRQGWKSLMTSPKTWAKNSLKSFQDIARTYKGREILDEVHSDIVSRDNALNGLYKAAGLDVYGAKKSFLEEAFPVSFGKAGKVIARPFKASENAFTAWQQRTRADLFDQYIDLAKKTGVDLTSKREITDIGKLVNSLTSRGDLGKVGERAASWLNVAFFSPRLFKSNLDVLTAHGALNPLNLQKRTFAQKQAAKNLLKIAVGSAMALKLAEAATGGKVESDPRSSNFGKVQVGSSRFDLTGGLAGLVTLGSRFITDSTKSSNTGETKKLNTGEFGSQTTWDVLMNFAENKLSPSFGAFVDWKKGEDFDGNKPTVGSTVKALTMPLIIQQYSELKDTPNSANTLAAMIAEGLGISTNSYAMTSNWNANNSKKIEAFRSRVGEKGLEEANKDFNNQFNDWYSQVSQNDKFWSLPIEQRESVVTKKKNELTDQVMKSKGFTYKTPKRDTSNDQLKEDLLKYTK